VLVVPQTQTAVIGEEVEIDINIVEVADLYGFEFDLAYDPSILEYASWEKGTFIGDGDSTFWITPDASTSGEINNFAAGRTTPGVSVSGSGTLATVRFNVIGAGTSPIRIEELKLGDSNVDEIPSTAQDGEVVVSGGGPTSTPTGSPTPTPTTTPIPTSTPTLTPIPTATPTLSPTPTPPDCEDVVVTFSDFVTAYTTPNHPLWKTQITPIHFDIPAEGYSDTALLSGTIWEGHPTPPYSYDCNPGPDNDEGGHKYCDQGQPNEEIEILVNGVSCYIHRDRNPDDDRAFPFSTECPVQAGDNVLEIRHIGDPDEGVGSVDFEGELIVECGGTPIPTPGYLMGDLNGDERVNTADLSILFANWGSNPANPAADLNGDGEVNMADLIILLSNWTG
jgi:hypothetical protein